MTLVVIVIAAGGAADPRSLREAFLEHNPAFTDMLFSLEQYDYAVQSEGGGSRFETAFYSALRTMLRTSGVVILLSIAGVDSHFQANACLHETMPYGSSTSVAFVTGMKRSVIGDVLMLSRTLGPHFFDSA